MPSQDNTDLNFGPDKGTQNMLNTQPVIPIIAPVLTTPSVGPKKTCAVTGDEIAEAAKASIAT